jgi:hypothetical protein
MRVAVVALIACATIGADPSTSKTKTGEEWFAKNWNRLTCLTPVERDLVPRKNQPRNPESFRVPTPSEIVMSWPLADALAACGTSTTTLRRGELYLFLHVEKDRTTHVRIAPPGEAWRTPCFVRALLPLEKSAMGGYFRPWMDVFAISPDGSMLWPCREKD